MAVPIMRLPMPNTGQGDADYSAPQHESKPSLVDGPMGIEHSTNPGNELAPPSLTRLAMPRPPYRCCETRRARRDAA